MTLILTFRIPREQRAMENGVGRVLIEMIALLSLYSLTLEKNMKNEWRISADI
jgi:hypothetical protein